MGSSTVNRGANSNYGGVREHCRRRATHLGTACVLCGARCVRWVIRVVSYVAAASQAGIRLPYAAGQPAGEKSPQLQLQHALLQLGRGPAWDARGHSTEVRDLFAVRAFGQQRVRWTEGHW